MGFKLISDMNTDEFIETLNKCLCNTTYHLEDRDSSIIICDSDNSLAAKAALLPRVPSEYVLADGTTRSEIDITCYYQGQWLLPVPHKGVLKNLDFLYEVWGNHKFPFLSKKEKLAICEVFSELALHQQPKKIYAFLGGWINDKALLIKNVLLTPNQIECVKNATVKKEVDLS